MTITKDKVVSIHYTLTNDNGEEIDSSIGSTPLEYVHGRGYLLQKLEDELDGKNPGDKFSTVIAAKDGYGEYDEKLVTDVPRSDFDSDVELEPGMQFQAMTQEGGAVIVTIKKVADNTVTIDGNHELAGVNLHFDVEVVDVREATEDEKASGRVGGSGCGGCGGGCGCGGECGPDCSCGGGCGA